MPLRRLPRPAHHPFGETPHPLAALRARLLAGLPVSPILFSAAVSSACRNSLSALHALAVASGLDAFSAVTNSLAARYAKAGGSFPSAARVFATARARDATSYNTILSATPTPTTRSRSPRGRCASAT
jgi:hypothetical protein